MSTNKEMKLSEAINFYNGLSSNNEMLESLWIPTFAPLHLVVEEIWEDWFIDFCTNIIKMVAANVHSKKNLSLWYWRNLYKESEDHKETLWLLWTIR